MNFLTRIIIALALTLNVLYAQNNSIFIGTTGGVNFSKLKHTVDLAELYSGSSSLTGLNGGVIAGLQIQNFTLSTGLQYIQKGGHYETDNFQDDLGTGFYSADEKLHYLAVPLLVGYRYPVSRRFGLSIAMGPTFNMGLGGKIDEYTEYYGTENVSTEHYTVKYGSGLNDDYKKMQMSFQLSPGLYYAFNDNSKLTFNVTWDSGLSDSFNGRYKQANDFFDTYKGNQFNQSTILTVGYEFHFSFEDKY